jgi:hypothetical protein
MSSNAIGPDSQTYEGFVPDNPMLGGGACHDREGTGAERE